MSDVALSPVGILANLLAKVLSGQVSLAQLQSQLGLAALGVVNLLKQNIMNALPVRQMGALLVVASAWVALHKIYTWVHDKIWATFYLRSDGEELPGHWVQELAKRREVPRTNRLDALRQTDSSIDTHRIEVKQTIFTKVRRRYMALEPQLEEDHMALVPLEPSKATGSGVTAYITLGSKHTKVQLNRLRCKAPEAMKQLLSMAHREYQGRRALHTEIFRFSARYQKWFPDVPASDRLTNESFIMPEDLTGDMGALNGMIADAAEFFSSRDWYRERGIPFRRGYLLHGNPGCGKTFFVRLLAGLVGAPLYVLDIGANSTMTNETLPGHIQKVRSNSVVILKNIDRFVANRSMAGVSKHLTFSGLLNVIDGALGHSKGLLMIMTTNSFPRLCRDTKSADALLRPGRVSQTAHVGRPSGHQLTQCFERMFGGPESLDYNSALVPGQAAAFVHAMQARFPAPAGEVWRSPFSWPEVKGLLMKPTVQADPSAAALPDVIEEFLQNLRSTVRARATKELEKQLKSLKRELRRGVEVVTDVEERQRAVDDSRARLMLFTTDAVIGLREEGDDLLSRRIDQAEALCVRIESGEVDDTPLVTQEVKCPKCGTGLKKGSLPHNYCDTPNCGGTPSHRCPNHNCDFDICQACHESLSIGG